MKNILIFCLFLASIFPLSSQAQRYVLGSKSNSIVQVKTQIGKHTASCEITKAGLNASTGEIYCRLKVADFDFGPTRIFQASSTVQRFLDAYMEVEKYPVISFEGRITDIYSIDFSREGDYNVSAEGTLSARGISKKINVPLKLSVTGNEIEVETIFYLKPADDYKLRADTPTKYAYFKQVQVAGHIMLIKP